MRTTDFAEYLSSFLTMYLPGQKGLSSNTIMSYSDTFKLVLIFSEEKLHIPIDKLTLSKFNDSFVEDFLIWLEEERNNNVSTRNQRLAAIRSFVKYVRKKKPEFLFAGQKILDIDAKKKKQPELPHLSSDCIKEIISKPNLDNRFGRRDMVLLSLMYDSGARVSEICNLTAGSVRLEKPYTVILSGKNNKTRVVPLMESTANVLKKYMLDNNLLTLSKNDYPLFFNHQHSKLTRAGVTYILKKYCDIARKNNPSIPIQISPHVFRHSKAFHMLQAGINLVYIRDFLGHSCVETTEIYARADAEMKRKSIENVKIKIDSELPDWVQDNSLMSMLMELSGRG